jgi:hypothetical protein
MGNTIATIAKIARAYTGEISPEQKIKVYKFISLSDLRESNCRKLNRRDSYPVCINFRVVDVLSDNTRWIVIDEDQDVWRIPLRNFSISDYINIPGYIENKIPAKIGLYKWQYDQLFDVKIN